MRTDVFFDSGRCNPTGVNGLVRDLTKGFQSQFPSADIVAVTHSVAVITPGGTFISAEVLILVTILFHAGE